MVMTSSESQEDPRPAEDPPYFRKRKTSKIILDALGVPCQAAPSTAGVPCQAAPSTAGEVALLNPLAADGPEVDPAAAADVNETPCKSMAITNDVEVRVAVD